MTGVAACPILVPIFPKKYRTKPEWAEDFLKIAAAYIEKHNFLDLGLFEIPRNVFRAATGLGYTQIHKIRNWMDSENMWLAMRQTGRKSARFFVPGKWFPPKKVLSDAEITPPDDATERTAWAKKILSGKWINPSEFLERYNALCKDRDAFEQWIFEAGQCSQKKFDPMTVALCYAGMVALHPEREPNYNDDCIQLDSILNCAGETKIKKNQIGWYILKGFKRKAENKRPSQQ